MSGHLTFPAIVVVPGALAAEARLLDDLDVLIDEATAAPELLARPVRVVVPSRTLRDHVQARLVAHRGRAVAGIEVVTLRALAHGILDRVNQPTPRGGDVLEILIARAARLEPALAEGLGDLERRFEAVSGTIRDLFDAGFEPAHAEALTDRLADAERGGDPAATRAQALVRVAAMVATEMNRYRLGRSSTVLTLAREHLRADPEGALPARAVLIHGFADATGVATDLLEALVTHRAARVILDEPPDPGHRLHPDPGAVFLTPLRERLAGSAPERREEPPAGTAPVLYFVRATGREAEVREAARRICRLLDAGAAPESIAVVTRNLDLYRLAVARTFERFGVPLSTAGRATLGNAANRRVLALIQLLRHGARTSVAVWLETRGDSRANTDLRLGLWVCGASRLAEIAMLPLDEIFTTRGDLPLPIRLGLDEAGDDETTATVLRRRSVRARAIRAAHSQASHVIRFFADRAEAPPQPAVSHVAALTRMLSLDPDWRAADPFERDVINALAVVASEIPGELLVSWDEMVPLFAEALAGLGHAALGGGGGVRVLDVTAARGLTFAHLFLLGVNRGIFPRQVEEDPLLPDTTRRAMRDLLPDLPLKGRGFDEERFLFADLLAASPAITVSWLDADDDGKAMAPSPLVERLRIEAIRPAGEPEAARDLWAAPQPGDPPRGADEHAVLAGLHGNRTQFATALGAALPAAVATGRCAVLAEFDPPPQAEATLGPYLGLVGPPGPGADPRRGEIPVTTLEGLARCPWQTFLTKILHLEAMPDPEGAITGIGRELTGQVVHLILARIAEAAGELAGTLEQARSAPARPVVWPAAEALDRLVHDASAEVARDAGLRFPGFARALSATASDLLATARTVDEARSAEGAGVVGVELSDAVEVIDAGGFLRHIAFRADRVERVGAGLCLTDFKSGKPVFVGVKPITRARKLLAAITAGTHLQAAAYAAAAGSDGDRGRYLFLGETDDEASREAVVEAGDAATLQAFRRTVETLFAGWDAGVFLPRLYDKTLAKAPRACQWCTVSEACSRFDTTAATRIARWVRVSHQGGPTSGPEAAALALWLLGGEPTQPETDEGDA